ncbi:MAG: formate/nitrite transporter family protein [Clostridia bacterium]|nr:formate/nitrite transporter family protein [Clostridia bacterium]
MKPEEILVKSIDVGVSKAGKEFGKLAVLGLLAGAFIALAAVGANVAGSNLLLNPDTFGLGKLVTGFVFTVGLMLVVLAGGELFTGNCLMITSLLKGKIKGKAMLRNWLIVYLFNFLGALIVAFLMSQSGMFNTDSVALVTVKIATTKANLSFIQAVILGMFCNFLVCLAVWIAFGADSTIGKIFGMFFPIMLFVVSGFEHSVANMYYIPAGIFAGADVTWGQYLLGNLLPVTIGNIIGGAILVGMAYWYCYGKDSNN